MTARLESRYGAAAIVLEGLPGFPPRILRYLARYGIRDGQAFLRWTAGSRSQLAMAKTLGVPWVRVVRMRRVLRSMAEAAALLQRVPVAKMIAL